jgi:hypothetical protein
MLTDCCGRLSATPNGFVSDTNGVTLAKKQGAGQWVSRRRLTFAQYPLLPCRHRGAFERHARFDYRCIQGNVRRNL